MAGADGCGGSLLMAIGAGCVSMHVVPAGAERKHGLRKEVLDAAFLMRTASMSACRQARDERQQKGRRHLL